MKPFVVNRHGLLVFPSNFIPEPDFSSIDTVAELGAIIRRDFEVKAPTGTAIAERAVSGGYASRYELLRDLGLYLFWMNRYAMAMYDKRPTRWRDVPRGRDDLFLPALSPWEDAERKVAAVKTTYAQLPARWSDTVEDELFGILFDLLRFKRHHATELPAIKPTVGEALADPAHQTIHLATYDPDYPQFSLQQILDCHEPVPELEALRRWAMTLHNQYPWDRSESRLIPVAALKENDVVVVFHPRSREVMDFVRRVKSGAAQRPRAAAPAPARRPVTPLPPVLVPSQFDLQPRIEALAVRRGELACTNDDIIRNSASSWSPMSAAEIADKTGIESRCYTAGGLEELALDAAVVALDKAGRSADEIGAVIFCTCTSARLLPSASTWLSGQLGIFQTHTSVDTGCRVRRFPVWPGRRHADPTGGAAPDPPGLRREVLRQGRQRAHVADDLGDGAAALVVGPAPTGEPG